MDINIKDLSLTFNDKVLFNNINLHIKENNFISILIPSSKGKTTFLNLINGTISLDNILINNSKIDNKTKKKISYISTSSYFYSKTVLEELFLVTHNIVKIKKILKEFDLIKQINNYPDDLTYVQKQKLNIIKAILNKSELLLIDNIFCYFDKYSKIEVISLLKKYQYEKKLTIICTTVNLEDALFCDRLIIINKEVIYDGSLDKIYLNEKKLKKAFINIPLENELIDKLKLYNLVNNDSYILEEVVEEICR